MMLHNTITHIGLNAGDTEKLAGKLNTLLANYQVFYLNVRGFHWNIKGENFFELHLKFEELYNDLQLKNDEIAERVLTLGHTPLHSYEDYLENSEINPVKNVSEGRRAVQEILTAFRVLIGLQRELLDISADANDEGTNSMMSDYIREQEKLVWMYTSWMGS